MNITHILKDHTSRLFFRDLSDFCTGIALTKVKADAMEFPNELQANAAAKKLRSEFNAFDFKPVVRS